jgi:hypothetical protein
MAMWRPIGKRADAAIKAATGETYSGNTNRPNSAEEAAMSIHHLFRLGFFTTMLCFCAPAFGHDAPSNESRPYRFDRNPNEITGQGVMLTLPANLALADAAEA